MRKIFLLLFAFSIFNFQFSTAQTSPAKFGRVDYSAVIQSMPEMAQVETNFAKSQKEYEDHLEGLRVELNNKINDFQKLPATTSEQIKQLKTREIQEMQERLQNYYQIAQEQLDKTQVDLMAPLQTRANEAIKKVCKASGIIVAFQTGSVAFIDEEATVDITDRVKAELKTGAPTASATTPATPATTIRANLRK